MTNRALRAGLLAAVSVVLVTGCAFGPPAGGDPGNTYLDELTHDPVFSALPSDARASAPVVRTPARYTTPVFEGGGWHGPAATLTFTSTKAPASVFAFFRDRAAVAGWTPTGNRNVLGFPEVWSKPARDGTPEYLSLTDMNIAAPVSGGSSTYVLNASTVIPG